MQRSFLWRRQLEFVGLIPEGLEIPFLESGSSAVHASVFALCMFRREKLEDDSRGSIRKAFHEKIHENPRKSMKIAKNLRKSMKID